MVQESQDVLPREFYEGMVSIRNELDEYGVPDEDVENALDSIEEAIIDAMEHCTEESDDTDNGEQAG